MASSAAQFDVLLHEINPTALPSQTTIWQNSMFDV